MLPASWFLDEFGWIEESELMARVGVGRGACGTGARGGKEAAGNTGRQNQHLFGGQS